MREKNVISNHSITAVCIHVLFPSRTNDNIESSFTSSTTTTELAVFKAVGTALRRIGCHGAVDVGQTDECRPQRRASGSGTRTVPVHTVGETVHQVVVVVAWSFLLWIIIVRMKIFASPSGPLT